MVCIGDDLPFNLSKNWAWCRVKHISGVIQYGISNSAKMHGNCKLLRITDIQNNNVIWENVPYTTVSKNEAEQFALCNGDLLFARTGGTVGKSFLILDLKEISVFASYLIRIQVLSVFVEYIKLFFESNYYWQQVIDNATGTGQPNVNGAKLGDLFLPLPPLDEQHRIVAIIKSIFETLNLLE